MKVVVRGESGRNEFLRGPFALFEAHSRAKFVRNLIKHGWASISPPELIPPPSPGQGFARDGRLRRRFSRTGHGTLRTLISEVPYELSSAMHFTERERAPQTLSSPAVPNHDNLPPGTKDSYTPPRPLAVPAASSPA